MSDNDNGVSGLGWFLAGLSVGALVGVLYAPKAGKETREELVSRIGHAHFSRPGIYGKPACQVAATGKSGGWRRVAYRTWRERVSAN